MLGSGLGRLAARLEGARRIPYAEIPHFPRTTVVGHQGELVAGTLGGTPLLVQSGRFHLYEGHPAETVALPVRVMAALGVRTLILTNAAGGIRRTFSRGALMMIADHVNLTLQESADRSAAAGRGAVPRHVRAVRRRAARAGAGGGAGAADRAGGRRLHAAAGADATRRRPRCGWPSGSAPMRSGCPPRSR